MKSHKYNTIIKVFALLTTVIMLFCILSIGVSADSGSFKYYVTTPHPHMCWVEHDVQWKSNAWHGWVLGDDVRDYSGTAEGGWVELNPWNADNIVLSNIIYCNKILGTFSVSGQYGQSGASAGVGITVSSTSTSATYNYSLSNDWKVNVCFNYQARCGGLWIYCDFLFETTAVVQVGNNFYQLTTGAH